MFFYMKHNFVLYFLILHALVVVVVYCLCVCVCVSVISCIILKFCPVYAVPFKGPIANFPL